MPVILDLMDELGKLDSADLLLRPERCVVVRNRHASCRRCIAACTPAAITVANNSLMVDADKCLGCGSCASTCPTLALEARRPTSAELLEMSARVLRETGEAPVFACQPLLEKYRDSYDRSCVIAVGCLGRLQESECLTLIVAGVPSLQMAHADCADCDCEGGRAVADTVLATLKALLQAWGKANPVQIVKKLPERVLLDRSAATRTEDIDGISRREFFTQFGTRMTEATSQAAVQTLRAEQKTTDSPRLGMVKVLADGTLPHFIPSQRERMLDQLALLGDPVAESLNSHLWGYLRIDAGLCNACRMCATFCPTGAITKFDDTGEEGDSGVEHYPADCVQCRLCEDICPVKAIQIDSEVPLRKLLEGAIIRFVMRPPKHKLNDPKQIYHAMYDLLGGGQIYER